MNPHEYMISGVKVEFPCKAYPSQVAMMNSIIKGLQRGQHALLESPTGSGKSLALLCAALAWQKDESQKARDYNIAVEQGLIQPEFEMVAVPDVITEDENLMSAPTGGFMAQPDPEDDDFRDPMKPPPKRQRTNPIQSNETNSPPIGMTMKPTLKKKVVPKIFFGTRTHKQIAQIIRELNKTAYKDVKMTILGSREHTCIHPTVSKSKNKNEGCKELLDRKGTGAGCSYHSNVKSKISDHHAVSFYRGGLKDAWDLEDLVKAGKRARACPYFASRELAPKSKIIFCPYNYLIDPSIRKSMDINLSGQICILDEAHNIEDSSRSAASWQVNQDEILEAKKDLERVAENSGNSSAYGNVASLCSKMCCWIDKKSHHLDDYKGFSTSTKVWTGTEIMSDFNAHGFGLDQFDHNSQAIDEVMKEFQEMKENGQDGFGDAPPGLHVNTVNLLEGYKIIMNYLRMENMAHLNDYRMALTRSQVRKSTPNTADGASLNTWLSRKDRGRNFKIIHSLCLDFWCLNPAVAFNEIKSNLRSIIVTSGTLSPMASFSTELDVKFSLQLEAKHVIDKSQVWIGTLGAGPTGHTLNATYRNAETFGFQDELGQTVLKVCRTIKHGVLLFLPSYSMLNKLVERWQQTGVFSAMEQVKRVIREPRFSDEFDSCIKEFYEVVATTEEASAGEITGALMMAVCRGKVSEGLDFADNNARAVICVGIPFPNVKDVQVDLKKKYNDTRKVKDKEILSGADWYEIQAFRALNQALGRCIRHRNDWGAILMVDNRFQRIPRYINSLSKWLRNSVTHFPSFNSMVASMNTFAEERFQADQVRIAQQLEDSNKAEMQEVLPTVKYVPEPPQPEVKEVLKPVDNAENSVTEVKDECNTKDEAQVSEFKLTPASDENQTCPKEEPEAAPKADTNYTPKIAKARPTKTVIARKKSSSSSSRKKQPVEFCDSDDADFL